MDFSVDTALFNQFPDLTIGVVVGRDIDNHGHAEHLLEQAARHAAISSMKALEQDSRILRWHEAYRSFGAKPKKHRCSVESLYRVLLGGRALRSINRLVDIYNFISVKYVLPVGGDDLDRIEGSIRLTHAAGTERFVALNDTQPTNPDAGEVVYRDDHDVLCRRWNWRECDKSKMTAETSRAVLFVEGLQPVSAGAVRGIVDEMAGLIMELCGGVATSHVITAAQPGIVLSIE